MFSFSFDEWYAIVAIALMAGTVWHVRDMHMRDMAEQVCAHKRRIVGDKQKTTQLADLAIEVVRTRLMVDAWLLRYPTATLRHPGAKIVLIAHMNALRAYHDLKGCKQYVYPNETAKQYDNPYWRAVWHVYRHGNVRTLPKCPLDNECA